MATCGILVSMLCALNPLVSDPVIAESPVQAYELFASRVRLSQLLTRYETNAPPIATSRSDLSLSKQKYTEENPAVVLLRARVEAIKTIAQGFENDQ